MDEIIRKSINDGRLILFFGAGASNGSENKENKSPPQSLSLAEMIAKRVGWEYKNESLSTTYSAAKNVSQYEVNTLLSEQFQNCKPSNEYMTISEYPWARIYTTNIDDALENALKTNSKQDIRIRNRNDSVEDKDQVFRRLDYVYLNGTINQKDSGFIFSAEEYGRSNAESPPWYEEMAADFFQCNFLFIGTKLDEPIFYHQIERYRQRVSASAPKSYVITPSATEIEKASLSSYGLTHISGKLSDFVDWLKTEIPNPPAPNDIALIKIPALRGLISKTEQKDKENYIELLKNVALVTPDLLGKIGRNEGQGTIRSFYRGFKPTWEDVFDGVPAELSQFKRFYNIVDELRSNNKKGIALIGPAGSGKSTLLKMLSAKLATKGEKVYFFEKESKEVFQVISELENSNDSQFYLVFDRLDHFRDDIKDVFEKGVMNPPGFVGG